MIRNPFMLALAVMNLAASAWYATHGNVKLALIVFCYAIASVILSTMQ